MQEQKPRQKSNVHTIQPLLAAGGIGTSLYGKRPLDATCQPSIECVGIPVVCRLVSISMDGESTLYSDTNRISAISDHKSRNDLQHCYCIGMRRPPRFECHFRTTGKSTAPVFGRLQPWVTHDLVAVLHYLSGAYALHLHHVQHQRHRRHLSLNKRW